MKNTKKKKMVKVNGMTHAQLCERMQKMVKHKNCDHYRHMEKQIALKPEETHK